MSTSLPYGFCVSTSGATYPGVPQAVIIKFESITFESPKSLTFIFESSFGFSYNKFSGYSNVQLRLRIF